MKQNWKIKGFSAVLAVVMMMSALNISVYAEETEMNTEAVIETEAESVFETESESVETAMETESADVEEKSFEETYEESIEETMEEASETTEETELIMGEVVEKEDLYEVSGIFGNSLKWTLSSGTLTISGKGSMGWNYYNSNTYAPWDASDSSIKKVVIQSGVTDIMPLAFAGCLNLSSVSIPNTVTKIGAGAFADCTSLTNISIPSSVKDMAYEARNSMPGLFQGCTKLVTVNIPSGVTNIGWSTFSNCKSLTSITLPNSITSIENWAFSGCINLNSITIPNSVKNIGPGAFSECVKLSSVKIPLNAEVCEEAFALCTGLKTVTIGDNVSIGVDVYSGGRTFYGCTSLTTVSIGKNVKIENEHNFENCTSLKSFTIAGNAPSMNTNQFKNVPTSMTVKVPTGATGYNKKPWTSFKVVYDNSDKLIEDFVTRLYKVCLNRAPDSTGLKDWKTKLKNKQITGVQAAYGFVFSKEFINKNLCNGDYVAQLYKAFLGRTADAAGKKDWVNKLNSGKTREEIFNGFALSQEFKKICTDAGISQGKGISIPANGTVPTGKCSVCGKEDGVTGFVTRLYKICLNRTPDAAGLADWTAKLKSHKITGVEAAYGFFFSQEFINKKYSNTKYVEYLYKALMDRNADEAGKKDWVNRMKYGWIRQDIFYGFAGSQEFTNICSKYGIVRGEVKLPSFQAKGSMNKSVTWVLDNAGILTISGKGSMGLGGEGDQPWFDYIPNIKKVVIKSGIIDIRECAFYGCVELESISIPNTVTRIGRGAFSMCQHLKEIKIPDSVTDLNAGNQLIDVDTFNCCLQLKSITIPKGVKNIPKHMFYDCYYLETIKIPKNAIIDSTAFEGCSNLKSIIYY